MALHGEIKVNGIVIGGWEATRNERDRGEVNDYRCSYWYRDPSDRTYSGRITIEHEYEAGAPALVQQLMEYITEDVKEKRAERTG